MKRILLVLLALTGLKAAAQGNTPIAPQEALTDTYRYRVYLADKNHNPYSLKKPAAFLSAKALARRARLGLAVDQYDLPVTPEYLRGLAAAGMKVVAVSKWNNTAVVETTDTTAAQALCRLTYVDSVRKVWTSPHNLAASEETDRYSIVTNQRTTYPGYYGAGTRQAEMLGVPALHDKGFRGEGMTIAVIDGGFYNADTISAFNGCRILGTRNFVRPDKSVYEEGNHGMMVLSCIGAKAPFSLVGTAPEASFYLLVSEDGDSEQPVEEDYWCAAVEYADSLGADIITSSLGYTEFDNPADAILYRNLNGRHELNSRSASLAASRGLLVLNSAGNSGNDPYKKIGCPADATDILAVGAVTAEGVNTLFSSLGNTADGRVKPDVMAMGGRSAVMASDGTNTTANGTSFSCPIMCGAVTCLWQAFPRKTPLEVMDAVRRAGHNAAFPDNVYGYGIPDMTRAYEILSGE